MVFDVLGGACILHVVEVYRRPAKEIPVQIVDRRVVLACLVLRIDHLVEWTEFPVLVGRGLSLGLVVGHVNGNLAVVSFFRHGRSILCRLLRSNALVRVQLAAAHLLVRVLGALLLLVVECCRNRDVPVGSHLALWPDLQLDQIESWYRLALPQ